MIVIDKQSYINDINNWSKLYAKNLILGLKTTSYIDKGYAEQVLSTLDTFAPVIRQICLTDMHAFHLDTTLAMGLRDDYDSFGDYCYDMLTSAYNATNECISLNAKLYHELQAILNHEYSDLSVSSNYIAWNVFSGTATLTLTSFRRASGLGLCYDISLRNQLLQVSNIQEKMQPKLAYLTEVSEVIDALRNETKVHELIDSWSMTVNDKLVQAKNNAELAWLSTYECYKNTWIDMSFIKQISNTVCTLNVKRGRVDEVMHRLGKTKTANWQQMVQMVIHLDYFNMSNVKFDETI